MCPAHCECWISIACRNINKSNYISYIPLSLHVIAVFLWALCKYISEEKVQPWVGFSLD